MITGEESAMVVVVPVNVASPTCVSPSKSVTRARSAGAPDVSSSASEVSFTGSPEAETRNIPSVLPVVFPAANRYAGEEGSASILNELASGTGAGAEGAGASGTGAAGVVGAAGLLAGLGGAGGFGPPYPTAGLMLFLVWNLMTAAFVALPK